MPSRIMNRRNLCKTIVTMGLIATIRPLKELVAVERLGPEKGNQGLVVCACQPRLPNGGVTSRKKREMDQGSVNDL